MAVGRMSVVYACTSGGEIYAFRVEKDGTLSSTSRPVSIVPASVVAAPGQRSQTASSTVDLAIHPERRFAYAANLDDRVSTVLKTTVRGFRIAHDGTLVALTTAAFVLDDIIGDIFMDPKGRYLYLNGRNSFWIYGVRSTGALSLFHAGDGLGTFSASDEPEIRGKIHDWENWESSFAFFLSGHGFVLYRSQQWRNGEMMGTSQFRILPKGSLQEISTPLEVANRGSGSHGPLNLSVDGRFLFRTVEDSLGRGSRIELFRIQHGDTLAPAPASFIPQRLRQIAAFDPLGRFVFGYGPGTLDSYRIESDGALTCIWSMDSAEAQAGRVFVEGSGRFLYSLQNWNAAGMFAIAADGRLTPIGKPAGLPPDTCSVQTAVLP